MNDEHIINLYLSRSETAISETDKKHHNYCSKIGFRILDNQEDTEECINDCYLAVWNNIPPTIPASFRSFIGKIMRNLSISLYRNQCYYFTGQIVESEDIGNYIDNVPVNFSHDSQNEVTKMCNIYSVKNEEVEIVIAVELDNEYYIFRNMKNQ